MAYSDFTLMKLKKQFGFEQKKNQLFSNVTMSIRRNVLN